MIFFWWALALFTLAFICAFISETVRSMDAEMFWVIVMAILRWIAIGCLIIWLIRVALGTA